MEAAAAAKLARAAGTREVLVSGSTATRAGVKALAERRRQAPLVHRIVKEEPWTIA